MLLTDVQTGTLLAAIEEMTGTGSTAPLFRKFHMSRNAASFRKTTPASQETCYPDIKLTQRLDLKPLHMEAFRPAMGDFLLTQVPQP
ncbi:hypothetical protein AV530_011916 [Patagioenas fasciata monilis]|uniref:Uncharacterized protein n=1 Tax=Patagioenas fasciata monilis TaxID=372326 RepID=A0A1V4JU44_PATFA|nr:hypothetical protein AV530_011916 [Patagioenas fasciata monilis]